MKMLPHAVLALAVLTAAPAAAGAQRAPGRLAVEISGGAAIPAFDFGAEDGANTGAVVGANAVVRVTPGLAAYAGYSRAELPCDNPTCGSGEYVSAGVNAGAELALPGSRATGGFYPWVRLGVLVHQLRRQFTEEGVSMSTDSDWAAGFQARAGIGVPLTPRLTLLPGAGYSMYRAELDLDEVNPEIDVQMVSVDLTLRLAL